PIVVTQGAVSSTKTRKATAESGVKACLSAPTSAASGASSGASSIRLTPGSRLSVARSVSQAACANDRPISATSCTNVLGSTGASGASPTYTTLSVETMTSLATKPVTSDEADCQLPKPAGSNAGAIQ